MFFLNILSVIHLFDFSSVLPFLLPPQLSFPIHFYTHFLLQSNYVLSFDEHKNQLFVYSIATVCL